jgi:hypothetical protein
MEEDRRKTSCKGLNASTAISLSTHVSNSCIDSNSVANNCASVLVSCLPITSILILRLTLRSVRLQTYSTHTAAFIAILHTVTNLLAINLYVCIEFQ